MMNKEQRLENDLIQLHNNVSIRSCDTLDHVEFIIQNEKQGAIEEVFAEIRRLIYNYLEVKKEKNYCK